MKKAQSVILFTGLILVLAFVVVLSIQMGAVSISFSDILNVLNGEKLENPTYAYIVDSRLNRTLVAVLAGGALAISGLILQVFFRNPLAGPGVLGISSGASLGVAIIVLGGYTMSQFSGLTLTVFAGFIGALSVLSLLLILSKYIHQMVTLLVIGLMFSYFSAALLNVLYQWANKEATREFVVWGLGSFAGIDAYELTFFSSVIILVAFLSFILVKPLNALSLGPEYAQSIGISIKAVRWQIILITGVLTATVTVFCGPIGFLGMAVPQLSRQMIKSQNHLFILPLTFITGSILALIADVFVRSFDGRIPLNTATSLIGAPIIIWVIFKLNKRS